MEKLRDIKGIVAVSDNSLLVLILLTLLILLIAGAVFYFLKRKRRRKRRFFKTPLEMAKERIEQIDYENPKCVAYTFIEDVAPFVTDENRSRYEEIVKALEPYKYKKEVPQIDPDLKASIQRFIKEIKWQI
jgi:ATP-dependent Zn protease